MYYIIDGYLTYPTASTIQFVNSDEIIPPSLHLCISDNSWVEKAFSFSHPSSQFSATRLLNTTPSAEKFIFPKSDLINVTLKKYVMKNSVCYSVDPSSTFSFDRRQLIPNRSYLLSVSVNQSLASDKFLAVVFLLPRGFDGHFNDELPVVYRRKNSGALLRISYHKFHQRNLKWPYASDCTNRYVMQSKCANDCMQREMAKHNVTPLHIPIYERNDRKRITIFCGEQYEAAATGIIKTKEQDLVNIPDSCYKECEQVECEKDYYSVFEESVQEVKNSPFLEIQLVSPTISTLR